MSKGKMSKTARQATRAGLTEQSVTAASLAVLAMEDDGTVHAASTATGKTACGRRLHEKPIAGWHINDAATVSCSACKEEEES